MARPKSDVPHVPVKIRVNIGLMDRLTALAYLRDVTVPKLLAGIMEDTLANLPDPYGYELHDMTETYALTKNSNVHLSANRMNIYICPQVNETMKDMAP